MDENRKKYSAEEKKDYYVPVMLCQILLTGVFLLFVFMLVNGKSGNSVKEELADIINSEIYLEDVSEAVSAAKEYIDSADSWAVFAGSVSYTDTVTENTRTDTTTVNFSDAETTQDGAGGVDLKTFTAEKNTNFAPYKVTARILNPVENGRYTSYFGYRNNPITGEFSFHTGLDIAADSGTPIRAAWNGVVTKVGEDSQAGKYIFLEHDDGFVTFYCHCEKVLAQKGAVIRQGETIAAIGSTGWSTGPHLHFEIRKDNIRLNPLWALEDDC